MMGHLSSSLDC